MSLRLIISHKRKQINHSPCIVMGGGEGGRVEAGGSETERSRDVTQERERARQSAGVVYHNSPLPRIFLKGHLF